MDSCSVALQYYYALFCYESLSFSLNADPIILPLPSPPRGPQFRHSKCQGALGLRALSKFSSIFTISLSVVLDKSMIVFQKFRCEKSLSASAKRGRFSKEFYSREKCIGHHFLHCHPPFFQPKHDSASRSLRGIRKQTRRCQQQMARMPPSFATVCRHRNFFPMHVSQTNHEPNFIFLLSLLAGAPA